MTNSVPPRRSAVLLMAGRTEGPPARRELAPHSIASVLADTWLMDYEPETRRLRYLLVGENIRARFGIPLVGKHLDDFLGPEARDVVVPYSRACAEKPAVSMVIGSLYQDWDRPGHGERLLLPLLAPDGTREGLIGTTICRSTFDSRREAEEDRKS